MGQFVVVKHQSHTADALLGGTTVGQKDNTTHHNDTETQNSDNDHNNLSDSIKKINWWDSVGIALFRSVFMVYCGVTIVVTAFSLIAEYNKTTDSVNFQLLRLKEGFEHTLINAIWELDQKQIRAVLYGMSKNPIISGVSITNSNNTVMGRIGKLPQKEIDLPTHALLPKALTADAKPILTPLLLYQFDLNAFGKSTEIIGHVRLYWNKKIIMDEVSYEFMVLITGALIKTLALWFIFIMFQRPILGNPLKQITQHIRSLDNSNLNSKRIKVTTRRFNEFKVLENYINTMTDNLAKAYSKIKQKNLLLQQEMINKKKLDEAQLQKSVAQKANLAKSMFLATVSHEIRSPMTGIQITTSLLEKTELNTKQKKYLETLTKSHNSLMAILNDILDINKIESGQLSLNYVAFNIHNILNELVTLQKAHSDAKNIKLILNIDSDIPTSLIGDPLRIRQILINLIGNAIKFTNQGTVEIFLHRIPNHKGGESIKFIIQDTGIGITHKLLPIIFEPFSQVDSSLTRRFKGSGLGLSICKKLITMMGGDIKVTSRESKGTKFSFFLELQKPHETETNKKDPIDLNYLKPEISLQSTKILLVEDNQVNQILIAELLQQQGYKITTADDGFAALEKLKNAEFDVVLMDIRMPGIDGFETTQRIRSLSNIKAAKTPIIAFSAEKTNVAPNYYKKAGMDDVIVKPIDLVQLEKVLGRLLANNK
ncbi:MAG: response regulator [Magnetococcales bacterium]|nr:response regulator [Magnetococcales bacterium]